MDIASGPVIVGYAGTAFRYNVSVFGAPVALAARCAAVKPADPEAACSSNIVMPAAEWGDRELDDLVPPVGNEIELRRFQLLDEREVEMKGLGDMAVREIHNTGMWRPTQSAEDRASASLEFLREHGRYWPRA
jgi:class 3 adenylate cyclase